MAEESGTRQRKDKTPRDYPGHRARGFTRAGGLIGAQLDKAAARRGYLKARLEALWPEIVGTDCAAITRPVKLSLSRGPAGGILTLAVSGAHGPQAQMMLPAIAARVNAALGPGVVGRVTLTQAARGEAPGPRVVAPAPRAQPEVAVPEEISSIGDADLRHALETLARNVLSRGDQTR